jgi:hypothetical protein
MWQLLGEGSGRRIPLHPAEHNGFFMHRLLASGEYHAKLYCLVEFGIVIIWGPGKVSASRVSGTTARQNYHRRLGTALGSCAFKSERSLGARRILVQSRSVHPLSRSPLYVKPINRGLIFGSLTNTPCLIDSPCGPHVRILDPLSAKQKLALFWTFNTLLLPFARILYFPFISISICTFLFLRLKYDWREDQKETGKLIQVPQATESTIRVT